MFSPIFLFLTSLCPVLTSPPPLTFSEQAPVVVTPGGRLALPANGSLVVLALRAGDAGRYTCTASNAWGSEELHTTLRVQGQKCTLCESCLFNFSLKTALISEVIGFQVSSISTPELIK